MRVLRAAAGLGLPDWWIGAGFVRNRVWDTISGLPALPERDVDVAYFAPGKLDPGEDARAEARAAVVLPRCRGRFATRPGCTYATARSPTRPHWTRYRAGPKRRPVSR
ncbi:nucleotidyltransferase family protein [Micromonospora sp. WMMD967]|nr:nucleotidyltransferase family protein [Micromonospora sp. WMMD967]MDG4837648.1 nucleotidyltransferase family protein [Micromonospora sp. WMMD967]